MSDTVAVFVCEICGGKRLERDSMQSCGHRPEFFAEYTAVRDTTREHPIEKNAMSDDKERAQIPIREVDLTWDQEANPMESWRSIAFVMAAGVLECGKALRRVAVAMEKREAQAPRESIEETG